MKNLTEQDWKNHESYEIFCDMILKIGLDLSKWTYGEGELYTLGIDLDDHVMVSYYYEKEELQDIGISLDMSYNDGGDNKWSVEDFSLNGSYFTE